MNKQAIQIAQDALKQLQEDRFYVRPRTYIKFYANRIDDFGESFQRAFQNKTVGTCTVCALGGLFISWVNIHNEVSVREMFSAHDGVLIHETLRDVFGEYQMYLIEAAFEGWQIGEFEVEFGDRDYFDEDTNIDIWNFYCKYTDPTERMEKILLNIIENDGEFVL